MDIFYQAEQIVQVIFYDGDVGLLPVVDIYDPEGMALVLGQALIEQGLPGEYRFVIPAGSINQLGVFSWVVTVPGHDAIRGAFKVVKNVLIMGSQSITILIRDRMTLISIADVNFSLYDSTGDTLVAYGKSNAGGRVVLLGNVDPGFSLDLGTYIVRLSKALVSFEATHTIHVILGSANNFTLEGTELVIGPPSSLDRCLVYGNLADFGLRPDPNNRIVISTAKLPRISGDWILTGKKKVYYSDVLGHFQFEIGQGVTFRISIPEAGIAYIFTTPFQLLLDLKTLIEPKVPD